MTGITPVVAVRLTPPIEVTIVQAPGCHFCQDAQGVVAALATEYPIAVRLIEVRSDEGQQLVGVHRPALNPLVLLDGEFFSAGRLPRGKLRKTLDRLVAARATASARAEASGPAGAGGRGVERVG